MEGLFSAPVRVRFWRPVPGADPLIHYRGLAAEEKALVARSVPVRKAEFGDARWCAHRALEELGISSGPILRGPRGMPVWPRGVVGSLSHTKGLRAAAVAFSHDAAAVGIDVEPADSLPEGVLSAVLRPAEARQVGRLASSGVTFADRILFCAKEATYKAWFPLTHRWLGFHDADVELRTDGTFTAYILARPTPVPLIEGRWQVADGFITAATTIREIR